MKKSLVLGAAALATMMFAAPQAADASDFKMGGYYFFRMMDHDASLTEHDGDNYRYWGQRVQLNMDWVHDKKTHAHMVTRILDTNVVDGWEDTVSNGGNDGADWDVRTAWFETELYGVGVKVGNMPMSLHDNIFMATDTTGFGAITLTKSFGNMSLLLSNVRVAENTTNVDDDDEDFYVGALFGKAGNISYEASLSHVIDQNTSGDDWTDTWLGATLNAKLGAINLTGTGIYEFGEDDGSDSSGDEEDDGFILAVRLKGKAGMGGWNAYGFYASENFDNPVNDNMQWSKTWDMGGSGAEDLLSIWAAAEGDSPSENMTGLGGGVTIKAGGWKINPMIDFAARSESEDGGTDSAWGGTLALSTKVNKATTLYVTGVMVEPQDDSTVSTYQSMHFFEASLKMKF